MTDKSKIEWTDSTFNPWIGCTKVAPACDNCYAENMAKRYGWAEWGNHPRHRTSAANWQKPLRWQKKAKEFFAEHGRKRRVFCASLADVFDNQIPSEWRDDLWDLIRQCPDLNWQLLTKRPQNIEKMKPPFWREIKGRIWLGTTVEDQERVANNVLFILQNDCAVRFISYEPALGAVNFRNINTRGCITRLNALTGYWENAHDGIKANPSEYYSRIDWIIAGGESGPGARPAHPDWFRSVRDQCKAIGVPFLFKQWGEWVYLGRADDDAAQDDYIDMTTDNKGAILDIDGFDWSQEQYQHPSYCALMARVGKKAAGRLLDGREWNEFPNANVITNGIGDLKTIREQRPTFYETSASAGWRK